MRGGQKGGAKPGAGRKPLAATQLKSKLADYAPCALEAFLFNVALMRNALEPTPLRREASKEVMDRLWGKAKQSVEHSGEVSVSEMILKAAETIDDAGN